MIPMKTSFKLTLAVSAILLTLGVTVLGAAQTNGMIPFANCLIPNKTIFQGVQVTITLSNPSLSVGSTNTLDCSISNLSTNKLIAMGNFPSISYIFLTNSVGKFYVVSRNAALEHVGGNTFGGVSSADSFREDFEVDGGGGWAETFFVPRDIDPGNYWLGASQFICTYDAKYSWTIDSNLVEVRELLNNNDRLLLRH